MHNKMKIISSLVLAVCAVLLGTGAYFAESGSQSIVNESVVGVYEDENGEEDSIVRLIFFETMTYVMEAGEGEVIFIIDSGSYALIDGGIHTFSETDDGFSVYYIVDGDRIFSEELDSYTGVSHSFKKVEERL